MLKSSKFAYEFLQIIQNVFLCRSGIKSVFLFFNLRITWEWVSVQSGNDVFFSEELTVDLQPVDRDYRLNTGAEDTLPARQHNPQGLQNLNRTLAIHAETGSLHQSSLDKLNHNWCWSLAARFFTTVKFVIWFTVSYCDFWTRMDSSVG